MTTHADLHVGPIVVDRYMLFEAIGGGGMATVHVGRVIGAAGFSRIVAIKRLHPKAAKDHELSTTIIDEARLASRIRHPNVVPTLDVVSIGSELLLVMEYVHGVSLAQLVQLASQRGMSISLPIATRIILDVLAGLSATHGAKSERGRPLEIVHRDISPQNIVIGTDGIARIVDFGIAKAEGKMTMTAVGQIKGKLGYMAPEQLRGEDVDRRADLYATGIVLWELATGKRLFDRRIEDLFIAVQEVSTAPVEPPSKHANVPADLDALLAKALDADPARRFQSAEAMALAVDSTIRAATTKELAALVDELAHSYLEKRSEILNRAEQTSEIHDIAPRLRQRTSSQAQPSEHPPRLRTPDGRRGRSRWALPVILAALAAMVIVLILLVVRPHGSLTSASLGPSPSRAPLENRAAPTILEDSVIRTTSDAPPSYASQNPMTLAPSAPSQRPRPVTTTSVNAVKPLDPACNPPYAIDSHGIRIPRRECFDR